MLHELSSWQFLVALIIWSIVFGFFFSFGAWLCGKVFK